jgi:hypothetical protein
VFPFSLSFFLSFFLSFLILCFFPYFLAFFPVTHIFIRIINFCVLISHQIIKQYFSKYCIAVQFVCTRIAAEMYPAVLLINEWHYIASYGPGVDSASNRNE